MLRCRTCVCVRACAPVRACACACVFVRVLVCVHVRVRVCVSARACVRVRVWARVPMCVLACLPALQHPFWWAAAWASYAPTTCAVRRVVFRRGVVVAKKVDPPLLGVSITTAWPALLILVFTGLAWRANGWRGARARAIGQYTRSFVHAGCAVALLLLFGFELAVLFNGACVRACVYARVCVGVCTRACV